MGLVRSGLAAGMGLRPKSGNCGIWLVNISWTVLDERMRLLVVGDWPSLRRVARISGVRGKNEGVSLCVRVGG